MFSVLHSDINCHKSGFIHLAGQPCCKKCRSAKVKDGIINLFLRNYLVGRYKHTDSTSVKTLAYNIKFSQKKSVIK
jgi:hypothetical protein